MNGVVLITDPEKAKVLVDPMRREMVRLLARGPMTENELAAALCLWKGDREELVIRIYRDALTRLLEKPGVLPERVRHLLAKASQ